MESLLFWILFNLFVLGLLVLDLVFLNRRQKEVSVKSALWQTAFWVSLAVGFNIAVYFWKGEKAAIEFVTGYLIEQSLSVDNLFVFMLIFNFFKVPSEYQRKVLFWGIIGALFFRAIFILVGVALIEQVHFTVYILGAFLVITGVKMAVSQDKEINPEKNPIITLANKYMRVTKTYHNGNFFVRLEDGLRYATPLFIVVLVVETTDIIFAADSIPAILGVTHDPFIVYTSNVFALLGLRSLYFALAGIMQLFHYLHYGLSIILVFIGFKLLLEGLDLEIPIMWALVIVAGILLGSILLSIIFPQKNVEEPDDTGISHPEKEEEKEEKGA